MCALFGSFLGAWALFPLAMLAASVGCGLLVRRLAGGELSTLLLAPVGFALVVAICTFATSYGWSTPAAGPFVVAATVAGFVLRGRRAEQQATGAARWLWPALAALAAFAAIGGPVFLTGEVGWTGYARIVDTAFQMDIAQHLADAGRVMPPNGNSSFNIVASKLLGIGYPDGGQATLGVMAALVRVNVAWCYQALLAFTGAIGALAIFSALGRVTRSNLLRFAGAAVAIQANILYAYALEAGIKELTATCLLLVVLAVYAERPIGRGSARGAIPLAVACSGAFAAFSIGIAPWLGLMLVGFFATSLIRRGERMRALGGWATFAIVAVVISIPGLAAADTLASVAGPAIGGVVDLGLGNLAAPVSRWASAGIYLTSDYRYPLVHVTATQALDVLVIALAVLGVLVAFARRRWAIAVTGVAVPIALYYYIAHSTAWIQLKGFTVTAVFAVLLAFVGIAALQSSRLRPVRALAWLAALAVAGGVLYGNAMVYHDTSLAPAARYHDLAAIASRYEGKGPALDPTFDEYAEYFLRGVDGSSLVNPANLSLGVRAGVPAPPGGQAFFWDLNQLEPSYLQGFPLIIQPRNPTGSRAPANYDLVQRTRYFDVWRRNRPAADVLAYFPLSSLPHERTQSYCRNFLKAVRAAGADAQIAYAKTSVVAVASPAGGAHSSYWRPGGPNVVMAKGAGFDRVRFSVPRAARYGIWLNGSLGRPIALYLDGHRLGSVGYEERYPDQFLLLAQTSIPAGEHSLEITRGNGSLHPGSGDPAADTIGRTLGAIVFASEDASAEQVYTAPAKSAARICAAPVGYEWLEVIRPVAAPASALPAPLPSSS